MTRAAERDGHLEPGDLADAEKELAAGGDVDYSKYLPAPAHPRPETVHEVMADTLNKLRGHGEPAQRLNAFRRGYQGGTPMCLPQRPRGARR